LRGLSDRELSVAHFWSGCMFMKEGNLDAAEESFREALRLNPTNNNALMELAKLLSRRGKIGQAARYFNQALGTYLRNALSPNLR